MGDVSDEDNKTDGEEAVGNDLDNNGEEED